MWYLAETEQHDEILYKKIANLFVRRGVGVSSNAFASGGWGRFGHQVCEHMGSWGR